MKIAATLLMLLVLFLPNTPAQEYTQWKLPEGAIARFGKGIVSGVLYSPDGTRLVVGSSIGIYLYDTTTYREVALITGPADDAITSHSARMARRLPVRVLMGRCDCGMSLQANRSGHSSGMSIRL